MYHTADLGWIPGENVRYKMMNLVAQLSDGDTVVFDSVYKISGNYILSDVSNITFKAANKWTCGLYCLDGIPELADLNQLPTNWQPLFEVGDGFTLDGLWISQAQINPSLLLGGGIKVFVAAQEKTGIKLQNLYADTMGWTGADLRNSPNALVSGCYFDSLKACVYLSGACDGAGIKGNYFTGGYTGKTINGQVDEIFFDGIKTYHVDGRGPHNAEITDNHFVDIIRDCIDTTGGLKDGLIARNVMKNIAITCLDLKNLYDTEEEYLAGPLENTGVRFEHNLVDSVPSNALVLTTTWGTEHDPDPTFAAGPVLSSGNVYRTKSGMKPNFVLNKNAKGVESNGDVFMGEWSDAFISDIHDYTPDFTAASVVANATHIE